MAEDGSEGSVFFDSDIAPKVSSVFTEAQKFVVVVSPYLRLWPGAKEDISNARKRQVDVRFVFLKESQLRWPKQRDTLKELQEWLVQEEVELYPLDKLHAKIYFNERTIVLSSMNMTESSLNNSEVALVVTDLESVLAIRRYALELMRKTRPGVWGCARCFQPVEPRLDKPLCKRCWREWEWENAIYRSSPNGQ